MRDAEVLLLARPEGIRLEDASTDRLGPSADHYPIPKALGGELRPWNVRVGHVLRNRVDNGWRTRVITLLKRFDMSLEEIAADLNKRRIQAPHGTNRWTAASVRRALAS